MSEKMTIGFFGTGIMGAPMARNLVRAGFRVQVWNRTLDKARRLADNGAVVCSTPGEAADGARVLVTMLSDGEAVAATVDGPDGALAAASPDAVWLQMSTVGVAGCADLAARADKHGVPFVDAPVLGTRAPAEHAKLVVLASGPPPALDRAQLVFDAVGSRTLRLGDQPGQASRLKLVVNSWVLAVNTAVGEAFGLAEALGVDPKSFLDAIAGGSLDCEYVHLKAKLIGERSFPPSFPVAGATKDLSLILEAAAASGASVRLPEAAQVQMQRTVDLGHGDEDMAAVYYAAAPSQR